MQADQTTTGVSPERALMHTLPAIGAACVLGAAADCSLSTHPDGGADTVAALADRAGTWRRGAPSAPRRLPCPPP